MRNKIQQAVANGQTLLALDLLGQYLPNDNSVILLKGRWTALQKDELRGTKDSRDVSSERNSINFAILKLVGGAENLTLVLSPKERIAKVARFYKNKPADFAQIRNIFQELEGQEFDKSFGVKSLSNIQEQNLLSELSIMEASMQEEVTNLKREVSQYISGDFKSVGVAYMICEEYGFVNNLAMMYLAQNDSTKKEYIVATINHFLNTL